MKMKLLIFAMMMMGAVASQASIKVVTTLPDLADLAKQVGGDRVTVDYIVRGDQNPHFVELKPSYMMKLKSADLFLTIGMELELWAPQLVDGSRNSSLVVVDLSRRISKLEVPSKVDAGQGDVHRFGNPHYWLDPRNIRVMVEDITDALAKLSPGDEAYFHTNAESYLQKLAVKISGWEALMKPYAGRKIITFHKSWSYFASWLGLGIAGEVEPKPGIAPSPSHTLELISLVRSSGIKVILVEPFYDLSAPEQISRATGAKIAVLPTSSGGIPGAKDYIGLIDYDISTLAGLLK
jgi:zinc/manganese transport system substrate-binding protein